MSSSLGCAEFSGPRPGRLPEKPSFSQKCSLLSQYLKEKGSFGDLSLGMTCNIEANGATSASRQTTTMNLFPCEASDENMASPRDLKSMNLFPQQASFHPPVPKEDGLKVADSSKSGKAGPQSNQLTIFYGGQVFVFNDFAADKAKEIMLLASKGSANSYTGVTSNAISTQGIFASNSPMNQVEARSSVAPTPTPTPTPSPNPALGGNLAPERVQPSPAPIACELPIARRASLHRFLEKRKDRITSRAPYQTNGSSSASLKPEGKAWLGLAAQPQQ